MHLASPILMVIGLFLAAGIVVLARWQRFDTGRVSNALLLAGIVLLALALGDWRWHRPISGNVAVMVDVSPSMRGSSFWNGSSRTQRVQELLGDRDYQLITFAGDPITETTPSLDLRERRVEQTKFIIPENCSAVLLFSDGQFSATRSDVPIYPVLDPSLESPPDVSIQEFESRNAQWAITTRVQSASPASVSVGNGKFVATAGESTHFLAAQSDATVAHANSNDLWPENNQLTLRPTPATPSERWWVSTRPGPAGWRAMSPSDFPSDASALLSASTIALDNCPADAFDDIQQARLTQYVRDLGGSVLLFGGDRAFGLGSYDGSPLDALSPLASSPPGPARHWILLADASGSMAQSIGNATRWSTVVDALTKTLRALPPNDLASIGHFSERLTVDSTGKSIRESNANSLARVGPSGPTNLQQVFQSLAEQSSEFPQEAIVLTDGEASLTGLDALTASMKSKRIRLHVLAIGNGQALPALQSLADQTGGSFQSQLDTSQWARATRDAAQRALADRWIKESAELALPEDSIQFNVRAFNRTWLKSAASKKSAGEQPLAASWRIGLGEVFAIGAPIDPGVVDTLANRRATTPGDPRLKVSWTARSPLRVSIDAVDQGQYLNGLKPSLRIGSTEYPIPQTAPGQYALELPAPATSEIATLSLEGRLLSTRALAGRYAAEFASIGTNHRTLRELAEQSGGRVIEANDRRPLKINWPRRETSLTPWLVLLAVCCISVGLIKAR